MVAVHWDVSDTASSGDTEKSQDAKPGGLSWAAMLAIVALAILVAVGIAYLLVNPFFHQHAP
jgi:hypothetical protein